MSYYGQGDYYGTGDYYGQGGFLSAIGGALKTVAKGAIGFATGGVGGALAAVLPRGGGMPSAPLPSVMNVPVPTSYPGEMMQSMPVQVALPGAAAVLQRMIPGGATGMGMSQQPAGYHINRSGYFLRDGTFVPPRTRWVRNRSRNNANGRALRRSISRVQGFNSLVKGSRKSLKALASI